MTNWQSSIKREIYSGKKKKLGPTSSDESMRYQMPKWIRLNLQRISLTKPLFYWYWQKGLNFSDNWQSHYPLVTIYIYIYIYIYVCIYLPINSFAFVCTNQYIFMFPNNRFVPTSVRISIVVERVVYLNHQYGQNDTKLAKSTKNEMCFLAEWSQNSIVITNDQFNDKKQQM